MAVANLSFRTRRTPLASPWPVAHRRSAATRPYEHERRRPWRIGSVAAVACLGRWPSGVALIGAAVLGYNLWLNILAERREIRVLHSISEGTERLPEYLTTQMTLVAQEPGNAGLPCTVKLIWIESGGSRNQSRVIQSPDRLSIRDLAFSDGIRESPHFRDLPVTLSTKGCQPWRLETSG